ncbi:MAG TPA: YdcF family protein [Firmicutes bacterium]|nr:YdcF family protein [Bacillota bacterium]
MRKFILALLMLVCTWVIGPEIPIIYTSLHVQPQPADVLIIPGARLWGSQPSALLQARLDKAVELYQAGYAAGIIVSGARGPDELASEAAVMRNYLLTRGIPPEAVYPGDQSRNTIENLVYRQKVMEQQGWHSAIVVTNPFHIYRCLIIAREIGLSATAASSVSHPGFSASYLLSTTKQYLRESLAVTKHYVFSR